MNSKAAKKTRTRGPESPSEIRRSWLTSIGSQEISALLLGCLTLMLFLALISYTPRDLPSWVPFSLPSHAEPGASNFIGPVGALVAGYAYFFCGAACFLVPAVLAWWVSRMLMTRQYIRTRDYVALAIFVVSAACLVDCQEVLFRDWVAVYNLPKSKGGFIGQIVGREFFFRFLGNTGAWLLMSMTYGITLIVVTGIHPVKLFHLAKQRYHFYRGEFGGVSIFKNRFSGGSGRTKESVPRGRSDLRYRPWVASQIVREYSAAGNRDLASGRPSMGATSETRPQEKKSPQRSAKPLPTPRYSLPSLDLLHEAACREVDTDRRSLIHLQGVIINTLKSFHVAVAPGEITQGPAITRYEFYPTEGLRVNKITALKADLARATRAERINILAPIPGKDTVGIEIANRVRVPVVLRELLEDPHFLDCEARLPVVLGKDIYGKTVIGDLAKMPHLLVAGATGSGKSVCINAIIASLLFRFSPDELKFLMIDPKVVEMQIYNALPHMLAPVMTDAKKVQVPLRWVIDEMDRRYAWFAQRGVRHFEGYNALGSRPSENLEAATPASLPYIVIIIDELADLMQTASNEVETSIARIVQKARAAGIHLIVATQTPRADVVTGIIKANLPSRIAFQVSSKTDSRIILDESGAENLIGKGDMLYLPPGTSQLIRVQGALITDDESIALVNACASQAWPGDFPDPGTHLSAPDFSDDVKELDEAGSVAAVDEELVKRCLEIIMSEQRASTSLLQRRLRLGYTRSARMIDILESRGYIGPGDGAKPREILVDLSEE